MTFDWSAILGAVEKATPVVVAALQKKPKAVQAQVAQRFRDQGVNVPTRPDSGGIGMGTLALIAGAGVLAVVLLRRSS